MGRTAPLTRVALFACCLFSSLVVGATDSGNFHQALDAARNDDWETLSRQQQALGDQHPLQAYLDFHKLRAALPQLSADKVIQYAEQYPDSPLPKDIRQLAIVAYGKAEKWQALLAISDKAPSGIALRCYYHQAQWQTGDKTALQAAKDLWATGQSRPNNCDPLFNAAREAGVIGGRQIWERQQLAFDANNPGLMRYLDKMLADSDYTSASQWLQKLYQSPHNVTEVPRSLPDTQRQTLLSAGLRRWAYKDTQAARKWFDTQSRQQGLTDKTLRERAGSRIAWYSTIRGVESNRQWLDNWLANHPDTSLVTQRARRTVIEQDWDALDEWVMRLPEEDRNDSRWLYWRARALESTDRPDQARELYQQAAQQRNFFAFLAADRLGEPYRFSEQEHRSSATFTPPPAITRIRMLRELNEPYLAHKEWMWLMWHSNKAQIADLADYALAQKWYDLSVQASIQAKAWNTLAWRFPPAYLSLFEEQAKPHGLDPWLSMAVARRESAFNPQARSPVGAMGLMQLMPATARKVAKDAEMGTPTSKTLQDKHTNIALGSRYLAELLDDFSDNRVLALAAYNAGPSRVNRWLENAEDGVPADVWIESIPFRETRDYVQAVLTYRALFVGMHDDQARSKQLLTSDENDELYSLSMLDQD
ncbi:transglycosylase SLT domain-containing protein [Alcanivorax sp. NBRC 102028]|jgi:soluble lytic murein transglycosylase|uniref:transglycosylase SLT domain-containing protein n=2 Tax=Alcanivoracaceae TaxID=224372 RepID=UPI000789C6BB|nr:transglycosylase SLT domain-containing protein [Alcanivorax sp. NBRC 102028]